MRAAALSETGTAAGPLARSARVVCGIDASDADATAVREACGLAGPRGQVALVSVIRATGGEPNATIEPARATEALERAMKQVRDAGGRSSVYVMRAPHVAAALLKAAADGDVLVVGTHRHGPEAVVELGAVATAAIHRSPVPVLVARGPPAAEGSQAMLVASDGSEESDRACAITSAIASQVGARITLLTVDNEADPRRRRALARQAIALTGLDAVKPAIVSSDGKPVEAIVDTARASHCSLVVIGGGHPGIRGIRSVCERVAHQAPCSVLVVRGTPR
jgi:nucleotide-binding universal stress UspA family protein